MFSNAVTVLVVVNLYVTRDNVNKHLIRFKYKRLLLKEPKCTTKAQLDAKGLVQITLPVLSSPSAATHHLWSVSTQRGSRSEG